MDELALESFVAVDTHKRMKKGPLGTGLFLNGIMKKSKLPQKVDSQMFLKSPFQAFTSSERCFAFPP